MKNYPRRYVNESAVKKALKIDSFRNLSKEKVMQFASMIPYMDKEVALKVIEQFPVYADFGRAAIEQYTKTCDSILEKNKENQMSVVHGYQTILDALAKKIEKEDLSEEERKAITEDMITVADKIAEADLNNKKFLEKMGHLALWGFGVAIVGLAAVLGVNANIGGSDMPELEDNNNNDDYEVV